MTPAETRHADRGAAPDRENRPRHGRRAGGWLALVACLAVVLAACGGEVTLVGTELDQRPAPDFTLQDATGQTVSLSDFAGKPVLLTFIYTNCPDVCPLTAYTIRQTYDLLPEDRRDEVAILAVSVDPERDTPEAMAAFSEQHDLDEVPAWHALTGDREALSAAWQSYGIDPGIMLSRDHDAHDAPASPSPHDGHAPPEAATNDAAYLLAHTDAIYIIDSEGRQRALLRSNANPTDLANNLTALLP